MITLLLSNSLILQQLRLLSYQLQIPPPIIFDSHVLQLFHDQFTLLSYVLHMSGSHCLKIIILSSTKGTQLSFENQYPREVIQHLRYVYQFCKCMYSPTIMLTPQTVRQIYQQQQKFIHIVCFRSKIKSPNNLGSRHIAG